MNTLADTIGTRSMPTDGHRYTPPRALKRDAVVDFFVNYNKSCRVTLAQLTERYVNPRAGRHPESLPMNVAAVIIAAQLSRGGAADGASASGRRGP